MKRAEALLAQGIESPADLLLLFPHRYIDQRVVRPIGSLSGMEETALVAGEILSLNETGFGAKKRLEVVLSDGTGSLTGVWFHGTRFFRNRLRKGAFAAFFGKVRRFGKTLSMAHPELRLPSGREELRRMQRIIPIYPAPKEFVSTRITSRLLADWIGQILTKAPPVEFLPEEILESHSWPERAAAFRMIHTPQEMNEPEIALERFKFEELFLFQLTMARVRTFHFDKKKGPPFIRVGELTRTFFNEQLPFELTEGQKTALGEIRKDLFSGDQMHRLLQGDVGSGKTLVAIGAILLALDNGYQAAFMAPTEILAEQHHQTLSRLIGNLVPEIGLLTGGGGRDRNGTLRSIADGTCRVIIGTHAIIQEGVEFHNLGLAVIDEQHRFGVRQRADLASKGNHPHLLVMSATPIPRSLAMTLYSDLDISVIRDLPGGRKPVRTAVRSERKREEIYAFLQQNLDEGGQAYIIYPLVEESEVMDLKDATVGYEKIRSRFPRASVGLLHGRMGREEKEEVMGRFSAGEIQILVSTTVVEVGVDVPNANVMLVEHAERFGLSQLHQLRGRIGRGSRQSYCILMPGGPLSEAGRYRLNMMVETNDGFRIAEADLKLRGPGDFLGTRQSGLPEFRHADIVEDRMLLESARNLARELIRRDPHLADERLAPLKRVFEPWYRERSAWLGLG